MSDEVKLEDEWVRAKAAKQEAAKKPPPKSRKGLLVALVGLVVAAGLVVIVVLAGDAPSDTGSASTQPGERVRIEIRAMPDAELTVDGKVVGKTPRALQFEKSKREITIEAAMRRHLLGNRGRRKEEKWVATRKVVLDRDQVIDFSIKTATLVESDVSEPPDMKQE